MRKRVGERHVKTGKSGGGLFRNRRRAVVGIAD